VNIRPFRGVRPLLAPGAWIDPAAVVIGEVSLGADSSVWPGCVVRGDVNFIRIGERTNIQDRTVIHCSSDTSFNPGGHPTRVGNSVSIGHGVILHGCTIEDDCLVGNGCILLDGCVLRRGAMVAAGSLVPPGKVLEGGYLWRGRPAQRVRELTAAERAMLKWIPDHYVELKNEYSTQD